MHKLSILEYFTDTVTKKRNDVAVIHNDENFTFQEINRRSICIANHIVSIVCKSGRPIAVFLPKCVDVICANIGILMSGNFFMNLDIKTPYERIKNILTQISPEAIITSSEYREVLKDVNIPVYLTEDIYDNTAEQATCCIDRKNFSDTDPMCIINTSGSTGTPKGVVLNHRSFLDFIYWAEDTFLFDGSEIIGSLSPVVFDIYEFELCMLMYKGSRLVLLDAILGSFPVRLLQVMANTHVNFIFWVPSIMVNIANLDLLSKIHLTDLKLVWFAGEVFPTKQFNYWYDLLPDATFVNLYGPIEITLDCTFYKVSERPDQNQAIPIGVPCRNTDIIILDDNNNLCDTGAEGELCVRGTSLAMGYYNNPEKTKEAFVQNPLNKAYPEIIYRTGDIVKKDTNGLIHFLGRKDSLIKHMGFRIELGEIEHVIVNDLKIVKYCCCAYSHHSKKIVLFYENEEVIPRNVFRGKMKQVFPAYMLPSAYVRMDSLPKNNNGKIDRLLLSKKAEEL